MILFKWISKNLWKNIKKLKNEATKGSKLVEVASKLKLKDFNIYIRTDKLNSKQGIINLTDNYSKGTHFVAFYENKYFDSFVLNHLIIISNQLIEKSSEKVCECYISSHPIQNINDQNCGSYCLYFLDLMQNKKLSFQQAIIYIIINKWLINLEDLINRDKSKNNIKTSDVTKSYIRDNYLESEIEEDFDFKNKYKIKNST